MATGMEDVAARAGVSTATVSRALRGLPHVSEETRRRVLAAAEELDYVISPTASRLATGRTGSVGVVVPYVGRWFFGQVVAGAALELRAAGLDLLLMAIPDEPSRRRFFEEMPLRRRVDAVLTVALPLRVDEVESLRALEVPVTFVGSTAEGVSSVGIDEVAGARVAVQHLVNLGHERIAMIGGGEESLAFTVPAERRAGYRAALRAGGLGVDARLDVPGDYTPSGGQRAMADLLAMRDPATAVFVQSDEMALGAIRAVRRAGLRVPGDVSIVGFDDHELAEYTDLTTVAQPVYEMGVRAGRQIRAALDGGAPTAEILPTHLVIRGTTAPRVPAG
jgi:DNA-binding LacI/PurR family transcriptional regulator